MHKFTFIALSALICGFLIVLPMRKAIAHCDGMDGPVVKAAQEALDKENINLVLIWIPKKNIEEIESVFSKSLAVRKLDNRDAKELADRFFFETAVRLHRSGEGAPYSGLKPAGRDLGPAIPAADEALGAGSLQKLDKLLTDAARKSLKERFSEVMSKKKYDKNDVAAGREYVEAYVSYIHYVEQLYETARGPATGHYHEPDNE